MTRLTRTHSLTTVSLLAMLALGACQPSDAANTSQTVDVANETPAPVAAVGVIHPELWPEFTPPPLDPAVEARIDAIMATMTVEQKVGQVIQADSGSVTPEEVREYRLGSVLSGGNSAPGPLPYADTETWLEAADAYFNASIDPEGVETAIPIIWGIDAVHGHANLRGAVVFPHNIGLGATRNPDLIEEIYRVTARELSVSGHDWTFAPTLAVPQDDRWGRTYEGFSEDPAIVASYGDRIVYGLQGRPGTDDFMSTGHVISSAKHFLADGGTENGRDQGDALISEAELRDIHAAGYLTAIPAGVQTVMASFSSWWDQPMHGNEALLTDILKERFGFQGFVVGDWNGHGLIPGCTSTDCPQAFNAGLDMYMAPDSWRELYHSTLAHVRSGEISQERLDDAVRRILRVKINSGIFEISQPSDRPLAGNADVLAAPEHRAVARQAVRESLVLLKNADQTLPLDPGLTVLVVGDGADDIAKASGGWTLSWQGGGIDNSEFPNGQTILDGIRETVEAAGGSVIHDPDGTSGAAADIVIAVYGENPYAEFQGDREHLDFVPNGFDTNRLAELGADGTPVVSVFLSGRPMWANPEINASDAFVAAWLPGSEGGGIADMLFRTDPAFDFTGRLSFSWPGDALGEPLNPGDDAYAPLFPLGYGLGFDDDGALAALSEVSGLADGDSAPDGTYYTRGQTVTPWQASIWSGGASASADTLPAELDGIQVRATDRTAQEDSLQVTWQAGMTGLRLDTAEPVDLERQANGAMELAFQARAFGNAPEQVGVGIGCAADGECEASVPITIMQGNWSEYRISLNCFADAGVDMQAINSAFILSLPEGGGEIGISEIRLDSDTDAMRTCGDTAN
ncbi:glycoside hydrolase family 3 protein [Maricaulis maris]|uniref:Exo-1,4-beta-glucosidase n=1 Tax=Maricaulis maris TaxID=74318 RepID=A0A495D3K3_9PROT|nr:exo 1,3/1,4-beta-D-glucan glucohydrolase [Maricaulis maris]RKQ96491.1 exo-1,4-beta-glucosidase [Maricaulis maris]